jgi:hypothetical protein
MNLHLINNQMYYLIENQNKDIYKNATIHINLLLDYFYIFL